MSANAGNPKTTLYCGGLEQQVNEAILHAAFIPFGDVKDVNIPLDHTTDEHRGFGFVEFQLKEDAAAAIDNMNNAELYGRVLRVNYAQPMKIKGGDAGWSSQPVWADADKFLGEGEGGQETEEFTAAAAEGGGEGGKGGGEKNPMEVAEAEAEAA